MIRRRLALDAFNDLKAGILNDLDKILADHPPGEHVTGHYAAALLIAVGCEALSKLRGDTDEATVFKLLMSASGTTDRMAVSLFDALRNGLAHVYDTKYVQAGDLTFVLAVGWGECEHMSILFDRDPPWLYLNVKTMRNDFRRVLAEVEAELAQRPDRIWKPWIHEVQKQELVDEWRAWFDRSRRLQ